MKIPLNICFTATIETPLGAVLLASNGLALTGLWFEGSRYYGSTIKDCAIIQASLPIFELTKAWLLQYFSGGQPDFLPEMRLEGTPFQKLIWTMMLEIPYGKSCSYKDLAIKAAKALGKECMACQAIGQAVARNPISILVPCHRVLASDGSMHGYGAGIERKERLLALEKAGPIQKGRSESKIEP